MKKKTLPPIKLVLFTLLIFSSLLSDSPSKSNSLYKETNTKEELNRLRALNEKKLKAIEDKFQNYELKYK